jgi:lytic murein transglycosylase
MTARVPRARRLSAIAAAVATLLLAGVASGQVARTTFERWLQEFRGRARARGIADATYTRALGAVAPDLDVFAELRSQPEFDEQLWQYLNRRVSEWRIVRGKEKLAASAPLLARIEKDFGVERSLILGLWGIESAFGDPIVEAKHTRPVLPALAALAWGEPRRRKYWESELLDALVIVQRGWATPGDMKGSWAGAMGHTQWMPDTWLHVGFDYDGDGRVSPFGPPDDALGSTARYLVRRGGYRRGEHWGYEVRLPAGFPFAAGARTYARWQDAGVIRADGAPFPQPTSMARLWVPVKGGPAFLLGANFDAVRAYNPATSYTLAIVHLGDRILGGEPFVQQFPGGERAPTLAEVQEIQRLLSARGLDTGGSDGRVGNETMRAVREFQREIGMEPADGYAGVTLLQRLRAAR